MKTRIYKMSGFQLLTYRGSLILLGSIRLVIFRTHEPEMFIKHALIVVFGKREVKIRIT